MAGDSVPQRGRVLLVNPWIYDFAAYNLWIEPLGLLTIAAALRDAGCAVSVVDCLAPAGGVPRTRAEGTGKFLKVEVKKPPAVASVPRRYGRYGLPVEAFEAALAALPAPDLVLVASGMTYWYPGVVEAVARIRRRFGAVTILLGGVYATLCPEHARQHSGADEVVAGPGVVACLQAAGQITGRNLEATRHADPRSWPAPAHDLVARPYAAILTSWGCPYRCTYCAGHRLQPVLARRPPEAVLDEIESGAQRGIRDWAFYDDALLLGAKGHLVPILEGMLARGLSLRLHTPNGLHVAGVTPSLASLLHRAGLRTVRLSLETASIERQRATGGKVPAGAFERAVDALRLAGFRPEEVGVYVLAGLPGQDLAEVEDTVRLVHGQGVQARLALFSPIPGTPDGDRALPPAADPLLHNNTVYPYLLGDEYVRGLERLVLRVKAGNAQVRGK